MSPTSPRQPSAGASTAPFKVHRDSHLIHKASSSSPPSSSSTNSSVSSSSGATNNGAAHRPTPRQKAQQPVIIYTHSPKVIRTNPRDFMSIVQKLTGLEGTGATANAVSVVTAHDDSSSSSESCVNVHARSSGPPPCMDPQLMPSPLDAHFMPEIPLFAPGASELLCASRGLYGRQFPPVDAAALGPVMSTNTNNAAAAGSGGAAAVFSPSMVEAMKTFPDY